MAKRKKSVFAEISVDNSADNNAQQTTAIDAEAIAQHPIAVEDNTVKNVQTDEAASVPTGIQSVNTDAIDQLDKYIQELNDCKKQIEELKQVNDALQNKNYSYLLKINELSEKLAFNQIQQNAAKDSAPAPQPQNIKRNSNLNDIQKRLREVNYNIKRKHIDEYKRLYSNNGYRNWN